jgi:hypothetical protein
MLWAGVWAASLLKPSIRLSTTEWPVLHKPRSPRLSDVLPIPDFEKEPFFLAGRGAPQERSEARTVVAARASVACSSGLPAS